MPSTPKRRWQASRCPATSQAGWAPMAATSAVLQLLVVLLAAATSADAQGAAAACPSGSFQSLVQKGQCVRCVGGKRCCTVGWTRDCPKCGPVDAKAEYSYSASVYALQSVDPPSCRNSPQAVCAPKIEVGVDSNCVISISNLNYGRQTNFRGRKVDRSVPFCPWSAEAPMGAAAMGPQPNLAQLKFSKISIRVPNTSLLEAISITPLPPAPILRFQLPFPNCTLNYRALTAPAAALLLTPPKPCTPGTPFCPTLAPLTASACTPGSRNCATGNAPAHGTCPPGHYLEASTTAKPPPCLPCPPGSYSPKFSASASCTECPAATYAPAFGSTACTKCPLGKTSKGGAVVCTACPGGTAAGFVDPSNPCSSCPALTAPMKDFCLGNEYGTACCALGACKGRAACKRDATDLLMESTIDQFGAALQLASSSDAKACKGDAFLSKVEPKAQLLLTTGTSAPEVLSIALLDPPDAKSKDPKPVAEISGLLTSTTEAAVKDPSGKGHTLKSDSAAGTVTVTSGAAAGCSATFKLTAGYVFELQPPKGAACPAGTKEAKAGGRSFCLPA